MLGEISRHCSVNDNCQLVCFVLFLLFPQFINMLQLCFVQYIEDITRWREDMNFIFEWQNNILRTSAASE